MTGIYVKNPYSAESASLKRKESHNMSYNTNKGDHLMPTPDNISVGNINLNMQQYKTKKQSTSNNNDCNITMNNNGNNQGFNSNNIKMQSTKHDTKKNT